MELMVILVCDMQSFLVCHPIPQDQTECTVFKVISAVSAMFYGQGELSRRALHCLHVKATHKTAETLMKVFQHWVWRVLQFPLCSPKFSPCNCDMIPQLNQLLQGKQFSNREDILTAVWYKVAQFNGSSSADCVCCLSCH